MKNPIARTTNFLAFLLGLVFAATLTGCATGPDFKTYSRALSPPDVGKSRVWFYRPTKVIGSLVQPVVYVNQTPLFKAQPGCFFYTDMKPGSYEIKCATEWADKGLLTVGENQPAYVRLTLLPGLFVGHILPQSVPEPQALKEMEGLHLITADGLNQNWQVPPQ